MVRQSVKILKGGRNSRSYPYETNVLKHVYNPTFTISKPQKVPFEINVSKPIHVYNPTFTIYEPIYNKLNGENTLYFTLSFYDDYRVYNAKRQIKASFWNETPIITSNSGEFKQTGDGKVMNVMEEIAYLLLPMENDFDKSYQNTYNPPKFTIQLPENIVDTLNTLGQPGTPNMVNVNVNNIINEIILHVSESSQYC